MPARLHNKVCLITGSTGIAAATVQLAAIEGAHVFVASRAEENCRSLTDRIRAGGGTCDYWAADLAIAASAGEVVERCLSRFGRIDALYNVAGISGRSFGDGPIHECTERGWEVTLDTNLKSVFLMCRAVINQMLRQPVRENGLRGSILNMASVLGFSPLAKFFDTHAYAASKGAIISLSRAMAAYYASDKIRINAIAPALTRTPMTKRAQEDKDILELMKSKQPLCEGLIEPEEVARASVFLLSDESGAITGELLTVDAGWSVSG